MRMRAYTQNKCVSTIQHACTHTHAHKKVLIHSLVTQSSTHIHPRACVYIVCIGLCHNVYLWYTVTMTTHYKK